jgi:general secretion pathway protein A
MYEKFFGLNEKPFQILSDPAYLFMSKAHENAYTHLEYGIVENKGFVVITGEIGSGKTTLINYLLEKIEENIQTALINNTLIKPGKLLKVLCQDFEIDIKDLDDADLLTAFYQFLVEQYAARKRVILIIDEAQNLSVDALEEVRMLSNFELEKQHLFQVILVGQPELRFKLQQKTLEQLAQRISVHYHISGLDPEEVEAYIKHRLQIAGAKNKDLFQKDALEAIYTYSRGIPRLINMLCDTAMVYAFADGLKKIEREIIDSVIRERELGGFGNAEALEEKEAQTPDPITPHSLDSTRQLIPIEQKIAKLEKRLDQLENRMMQLTGEGGKHENLIFELFKLLQKNLESRYHLLNKMVYKDRNCAEKDTVKSSIIPIQGDTRFRF